MAPIQQTCFYYASGVFFAFIYEKLGSGDGLKKFAQSITGTGQRLKHVGLLLDEVNNPAAGITVSVRQSLDGPDVSFLTISLSEVCTSMAGVYKQLSSTVSLETGGTYYIVVETANEDSSNYYDLYENLGSKNGDIY
jgi:hypothetical protein